MRQVYVASALAAIAIHGVLLFVIKPGTAARPLAMSDKPSAVDVNLVEATPEPPAPPPPEATPASTPEPPMPTPEPEMQAPVPEPAPSEPGATPVPMETAPVTKPIPVNPTPRPVVPSKKATAPASTMKTASNFNAAGAKNGPITQARYRSNPRPDYPPEARRQHQEGVVLLSVEVGVDGRPTGVTLKRGSGYPLLDQAAIRAVRGWTFEPARMVSIPVSSRVDVPVRFSLSN